MAEYIDRETVIKSLEKLCDRVCQYSKAQRKVMCSSCPLGDAFTVIEDDIPQADVRPVVFCGGCCWFTDTGYSDPDPYMPELRMGHCLFLDRDVQACWFCGTGEWRERVLFRLRESYQDKLLEAIKRNTTGIEEKANVIRAEYIRHLQEKNKALDEELASLRETFLQATRGGRVDADEKD